MRKSQNIKKLQATIFAHEEMNRRLVTALGELGQKLAMSRDELADMVAIKEIWRNRALRSEQVARDLKKELVTVRISARDIQEKLETDLAEQRAKQ